MTGKESTAGRSYDTIVIGAGVIGISTARELARRGQRVAIVDRFGSGHDATSSAGATRSIRVAYDHPFYVALALDAIAGWRDLEAESGRTILHLTGQVDIGPAAKLDSMAAHVRAAGVEIVALDAASLGNVFPEMQLGPDEGALYHQRAGTVLAAEGMLALLEGAVGAGAQVFAPEAVTAIARDGEGVRVTTEMRVLGAARAIVAAGPWSGDLLRRAGLLLPLSPALGQVTFLDAPGLVDRPGIAEWAPAGGVGYYGHPVPGLGYKVAHDAGAPGWDGDTLSWSPDPDEERRLLDWFGTRFPGIEAKVTLTQRHPWTMTPDADFIIDHAGGSWGNRLLLACGCSGHAFKFGPALGDVVADIVGGGAVPALTRLGRPGLGGMAPAATVPITR